MSDLFRIDPTLKSERRSPMESGIVRWESGEAIPTTFDLANLATWQPAKLVARLEQAQPSQLALHIRFSAPGSAFDHQIMANFPELASVAPFTPAGVLIVEYGDLTGRHRIAADLRSGTYRLPACTFAQVSALQWHAAGATFAELAVQGALSRALDTEPKLFTYTGGGNIPAAGIIDIRVPYYATHFDVWAINWTGGPGDPNAPILRAMEAGVYRDYLTPQFVPPWGPVSLPGDVLMSTISIENAGAQVVRVFAQFHLEP